MDSLITRPGHELFIIKGISESRATSLLEKACQLIDFMTPVTCASLLKESESAVYISTGSKELDKLFEGGVLCGCITEFEGEYRTGKSQICMTLSVLCQLHPTNPGSKFKFLTDLPRKSILFGYLWKIFS